MAKRGENEALECPRMGPNSDLRRVFLEFRQFVIMLYLANLEQSPPKWVLYLFENPYLYDWINELSIRHEVSRSERRMFFASSTPHRIHKTCILWLLPVITSTKIPQFWLIHLLLVLQRRTPSPRGTATRLRKERLHAGAFRLASAKKSITLQVAVFIIYSLVLRRETSHPPIPHYGGAAGGRTRRRFLHAP